MGFFILLIPDCFGSWKKDQNFYILSAFQMFLNNMKIINLVSDFRYQKLLRILLSWRKNIVQSLPSMAFMVFQPFCTFCFQYFFVCVLKTRRDSKKKRILKQIWNAFLKLRFSSKAKTACSWKLIEICAIFPLTTSVEFLVNSRFDLTNLRCYVWNDARKMKPSKWCS